MEEIKGIRGKEEKEEKRKKRKCEKILSKIFAILEDFIKQNMNGFANIVALSPTPYSWALVLGLCPGA